MKTPLLLAVVLPVLAAGCGDHSTASGQKTNAAASSGNPLSAPADYLRGAVNAEQTAIKTIDTTAVTSAIQQFQVDRGRLPKDLDELVQEKFLPKIPPTPYGTKLLYDPNTGEVKVVKL